MDQKTFARFVHECLVHLNDQAYLQSHPLTEVMRRPDRRLAASEEVRWVLLGALDRLRPPSHVPAATPAGRGYHHLIGRYVEGRSPKELARELMVSYRQARRDHHLALLAVTSILWERYSDAGLAPSNDPSLPPPVPAT